MRQNDDIGNFNTNKIEAQLEESIIKVEQLISNKTEDDKKYAKEVINNLGSAKLVLLVHLIPEVFIDKFNDDFSSISWINSSKARTLLSRDISIINTPTIKKNFVK